MIHAMSELQGCEQVATNEVIVRCIIGIRAGFPNICAIYVSLCQFLMGKPLMQAIIVKFIRAYIADHWFLTVAGLCIWDTRPVTGDGLTERRKKSAR